VWGCTKPRKTKQGGLYHVGVRYTSGAYALVLDYAKQSEPSWGFIARFCLTNPNAYDTRGRKLADRHALNGDLVDVAVPRSAPHAGLRAGPTTLKVKSTGTLRSGPKSFAIGNVRASDRFVLPTIRCGKHAPLSWVLGYAPSSGRWRYVQARHLPTCTSVCVPSRRFRLAVVVAQQ
jgi:hypothetical protein